MKSRKPFIYNKALLEHREQVLQRQRLAPPWVLPVHKSLPFIGIYILFLSLCYYSLHKCRHANWRNSICGVVLWWVGSRKPFLYSMEELADMTDNFNEKNLIGETLFTKLYRGTIRHGWLPFEDWVVTVKIWDCTLRTSCYLNANESLMYICFLLN